MRPVTGLPWVVVFAGCVGTAAPGPVVRVTATYPGATARVVDETVVAPLLTQIQGLDRVARIESEAANDGTATITVRFAAGADPHLVRQEVANRVALAEPQFPDAVRQGGAKAIEVAVGPEPSSARVALTGPDARVLRGWADAVAGRVKTENVGAATVSPGPDEPTVMVEFDREKAVRAGVSMAKAADVLKATRAKPGAKIEETGAIELSTDAGKTVRLDAVAAVKVVAEPPVVRRVGGERAVDVIVVPPKGATAADVATKVKAAADAVREERRLAEAYKVVDLTTGP